MLEKKPLDKIMSEYLSLLEKYEGKIENLEKEDIKRLIGEVRLFWYRQQRYIKYFMANIEKTDSVAYLAGAVRLDIINDGHLDFVLVGKHRIVTEPIMKLSPFYGADNNEINFEYANKYIKDCLNDLFVLLRNYRRDFMVLPLEPFILSDAEEYHDALFNAAELMMAGMFGVEVQELKAIINEANSYEEVEMKLLPGMCEQLIFESFEDAKLSLREKCDRYLEINGHIMPIMKDFSEAKTFYMIVNQNCMRAFAIANLMRNCKMIPFIRNDVTFQFFTLIFHSNIMEDLSNKDYFNIYIPYVLQKAVDFSDRTYDEHVTAVGNGKLVEFIINHFEKRNVMHPMPREIVQCVELFYKTM